MYVNFSFILELNAFQALGAFLLFVQLHLGHEPPGLHLVISHDVEGYNVSVLAELGQGRVPDSVVLQLEMLHVVVREDFIQFSAIVELTPRNRYISRLDKSHALVGRAVLECSSMGFEQVRDPVVQEVE